MGGDAEKSLAGMTLGNLEYLMSSLPYLSFLPKEEEKASITALLRLYDGGAVGKDRNLVDILIREATKYLSGEKLHLFAAITLENIHRPEFQQSTYRVVASYARFSFALKDSVRQLRTLRKGSQGLPPAGLPLPLKPGDPLQEEIKLMTLQWQALDRLSIGHYADFSALIIYKIKLQVLERFWQFDQRKGMDIFRNITKRTVDGR